MGTEMKQVFPFEDRTLTLRDGRRVRVRRGGVGDAVAFREYIFRVSPTSDQIGLYQNEVGPIEDYERQMRRADPVTGGLSLLAECEDVPGVIIADCCLNTFPRRKLGGVLILGILCDEAWRGVGLGRALLEASLVWARANPAVRRVELGVLETNPGAIALYESLGFVAEGRARARFLQEDGSLVDDLSMALDVGSAGG